EVAIIGAGPYGLSIAAHLRAAGVSYRIFGSPMQTWREQMPRGMLLKSDGFASNLSSPGSGFTLQEFCSRAGYPYHDNLLPVPLEVFTAYGLEFQNRMVPNLEAKQVIAIKAERDGFRLAAQDGESTFTRNVVLAVGITYFHYTPPILRDLPAGFVSHSSAHRDVEQFRGKCVTVVGSGASAIDLAALLHEAGAEVTLVARSPMLHFHKPPQAGRSAFERLRHPSSGIGPGWRSRMYTDAPWLFHSLPQALRLAIVRRHLAPAAGWPMKERVVGRMPLWLGCTIRKAEVKDNGVCLAVVRHDGSQSTCAADHVISATGYRVDLRRLPFLNHELRSRIRAVEHTPILSRHFESSVPGLYFVGVGAANSFGPMMRFAFGASFTASHISQHLADKLSNRVSTRLAAAI
ncbi:MAG: NAD(P)/FAD-dependent oxidoreductase, partial [Acidobacteriia bacterium]|nr:NAD(P)/FAD-dependent oxidoreductase [Terriglobia bacterium]